MLQVRSDRRDHRPFGLYGGSPGAPSENYLNPDGENRLLPSKLTMTIKRATCSATSSPAPAAGAIRWSAIPRRCCATCATSFCRRRRPRADYGVVIDDRAPGRRRGATARRARGDPRGARLDGPPKVQWHDPMAPRRAAE